MMTPFDVVLGSGLGSARPDEQRGGFALVVVVFLLFAVGIAAATGYAVVSLEADMAGQASESAEALATARAGLERYVGEHLGIPEDSTVYAVANGNAVVRARRLATVDAAEGIDLYLLESEGSVIDAVNPESPARAVVTQYAHLHTRPLGRHAAMILSFANVNVSNWGQIRGTDHSSSSACAESGTEAVPSIVHRGTASITTPGWDSLSLPYTSSPPGWGGAGAVVGVPVAVRAFADHSAVYDSVGLRWDVLTDADFPVAYDGTKPDYSSIPSSEYPVVRYRGDLYAGSSWSGRGVLIVTGRLTFGGGFFWDGVVLAGDLADTNRLFWIRGMLVAGMNGTADWMNFNGYPLVFYDVCSALAASNALAYFEPLDGSWWEVR
jgi:Tfp pilus assembly protein PilX